MADRTCPKCGDGELETDPARGDVTCTSCGLVISNNTIVNEIQFAEGRAGGSHVVGQNVSGTGARRLNTSSGLFNFSGRESRQVTLDNAERRIKEVAAQIKLNSNGISLAHNIYKRALQKRLTHGRKNTHVIAACVYMACRMDPRNNSIMLLDLSDAMRVNVYELGRTFLKLSTALHLNIPTIDPCIYIIRYIHQLPNLSEHKLEIESTAMRITKRMKRDWMHFGRRPSGLCGAAILVASRLHGVHCAVDDIIKVVKVCEATIRKRLNEFGDTPTSRLTLEEFMSVDLEGEEDPPCFKSARKKVKVVNEGELLSDEILKKVNDFEEQIEKELEKVRSKRFGRYASLTKLSPNASSIVDESSLIQEFVNEETITTLTQVVPELFSNVSQDANQILNHETESLTGKNESIKSDTKNSNPATHSILETANEDEDGILKFDDLDDDELDSYLMDDTEANKRKELWEVVHADWIKESEAKAAAKAKEEEELKAKEAAGEVIPVKKKRKIKKKSNVPANTAGEAVEKMLQEKRLSNKINYEALNIQEPKSNSFSGIHVTHIPKLTSGPSVIHGSNSTQLPSTPLSSTTPLSSRASSSMTSPLKGSSTMKRLPSIKSFVPPRTMLTRTRLKTTLKTSTSSASVEKVTFLELEQTVEVTPVLVKDIVTSTPKQKDQSAIDTNDEDEDEEEEDEEEDHATMNEIIDHTTDPYDSDY